MADENNGIVQTDEDYMKIGGMELREKEGKKKYEGLAGCPKVCAALQCMCLIFGCYYDQSYC